MKAVKCPICEGKGKLADGEPCYGCGSRGWVEVNESNECPVVYGIPPIGAVVNTEEVETGNKDEESS